MKRGFPIAVLLLVASCDQPAPAPTTAPEQPQVVANAVNDDALAKARALLEKEGQIRDFVLDPANAVILQAAVDDDGSRRYGYAEYLCIVLGEAGISLDRAVVRIVDAGRVQQSQGDFRSISLGTVQCKDQQRWD